MMLKDHLILQYSIRVRLMRLSLSADQLRNTCCSFTHNWAWSNSAIADVYTGEMDIVNQSISLSGSRAGPRIDPSFV